MRDIAEPRLSLTEWRVLCVAAEKPTHGFAVAAQLGRDSELGAVWHVTRPQSAQGAERTVMPCRREAMSAALRFLDGLHAEPALTAAVSRRWRTWAGRAAGTRVR